MSTSLHSSLSASHEFDVISSSHSQPIPQNEHRAITATTTTNDDMNNATTITHHIVQNSAGMIFNLYLHKMFSSHTNNYVFCPVYSYVCVRVCTYVKAFKLSINYLLFTYMYVCKL